MADTLLLTDDWTGTTGAGWNGSKWGTNAQSGSGVSIQSNRGAIVMPNTGNVRSLGWALTQNSLNGEVLVTFNKGTVSRDSLIYISPAGDYAGNAALGSAHPAITNGVYVVIPSNSAASGAAYLLSVAAGVVTTGPTVPVAINLGTDYKCRIRRAGNYLAVKVWSGTTEPTAWSQVWTPAAGVFPTNTTDQRAMMMVRTNTTPGGTQTVVFDDLTSSLADDSRKYTAQVVTATADMPGGKSVVRAKYIATPLCASATFGAGRTTFAGRYTAQAMGASATIPGGRAIAVRANTIKADPLAASVTMPGGKSVLTRVINTNRDASSNGLGTNSPNGTANAATTILADFELPPGLTNAAIASAVLTIRSEASANVTVKTLRDEWVSGQSYTGTVSSGSATGSRASGGVIDIDITSLIDTAAFYGVQITGTGSIYTEESVYVPKLTLRYTAIAKSVTAPGQPFTASANLPDAKIGIGKTNKVDALTALATLNDATVRGFRSYKHTASPLTASIELGEHKFARPITVRSDAFTAALSAPTAVAKTALGFKFLAEPLAATATWVKPSGVNGAPIITPESDDAYFNRVFGLAPKVWQRLADKGSIAVDRMATYNGVYHGVQIGKFTAPDGRHSVHFPLGSYIEQNEPTGSNQDEAWLQDGGAASTTLEFSFKTGKQDAFILAGADSTQTSAGVKSSYAAREVFIRGGKLTFRSRLFAGTPDQIEKEFTGFRNIADNKWHHVVIRSGVGGAGGFATEMWIDGAFEIRRYGTNGFLGFPDFIGFRPNYIDGSELETLPLSQGFEGDMSEVVFYNHNNLASSDIAGNFYAFMGYNPIKAEPFGASAKFGEHKAKGSQKKALYLYWSGIDEVFGGMAGGPANQAVEDSISYDPNVSLASASYNTNGSTRANESISDMAGMKVYTRSIQLRETGVTSQGLPITELYTDPVTDDPSLINLFSDLDLTDYSVIMFKDWPDEGYERQFWEDNYPGQINRLLNQIREANDNGVGLNITNPRLAADLGIVDRVEYVKPLKESKYSNAQGAASGLYDYGSAVKFPWNTSASDGLTGGSMAIGIGVTQDDAVWHVDYDFYGWQGVAYKYLKREQGLQIGDEFIFNGAEVINARWQGAEKRYNRYNGTWATPPGHVKAGTVVTTFGAKQWVEKSYVDNPYKDYATTIVLDRGDKLNGKPVGGRIFVNFTEQPSSGDVVVVQNIPTGAVGWPQNYPTETTAQREWDYSWSRTSLTTTGQNSTESVSVVMPNGEVQVIKVGSRDTNLSMVRSNQFFSLTAKPRMEMTARGLLWLAAAEEPEPGSTTVRAEPMEASASMGNSKVVALAKVKVKAQVMLAVVDMPAVKGDKSGSARIRALPMTAEAKFTQYGKRIYAQPFMANAEIAEPFNAVHTSGEQVTLTVYNYDVELYLKEEN